MNKTSLVLISLIAVTSSAHGQAWRDCTRGSIGPCGYESIGPGGGMSIGSGEGKSLSNLRGLNPDTMKPYP